MGGACQRHDPEATLLHKVVRQHWRTLEAELRGPDGEGGLPGFISAEFEAFVRCGVLAHGFLRVHCDACGADRVVAFSCKKRGFCGSCMGRRMSAFGAHCVDSVFPAAPVRQWVLTVPIALRFRMAASPVLTGQVLAIAVRVVSSWLRRQARSNGTRGGILKTGAVTVIQRFDSALGLNVHFHMLFVDGVFRRVGGERPEFVPVPAPRDRDVGAVAEATIVKANDRTGLEALCRYMGRPPLSQERLKEMPNGDVKLRLKRRWSDGTTHLVLSPTELIEKLIPLIPRPRTHTTRYHGVFAPASGWREQIVPRPLVPPDSCVQTPETETSSRGSQWIPWAVLLKRVFLTEALACRCGARMRILAAITGNAAITAILTSLNLPCRAPSLQKARPPPGEDQGVDAA